MAVGAEVGLGRRRAYTREVASFRRTRSRYTENPHRTGNDRAEWQTASSRCAEISLIELAHLFEDARVRDESGWRNSVVGAARIQDVILW